MRWQTVRKLTKYVLTATGVASTLVTASGCMHPVRTVGTGTSAPAFHAHESPKPQPFARFRDTLTLTVGMFPAAAQPTRPEPTLSLSALLDSVAIWCSSSAQTGIEHYLLAIAEERPESDSLHWEALFQLGECYAIRGEYQRSLGLLGEIAYRSGGVPIDVHQRAIVRIGHIFCVLNQLHDAEEQFQRLRQLYPSSPYRVLADCQAIR